MREYFFWGAAIFIPTAIVGLFLWMLGRALITVFSDWRLGRELKQLERESEARREQKRLANAKRLDTGCEHDFEYRGVGLPPDVCAKCGLEKDKPTGPCDHRWRIEKGPVPGSRCEKCGKTCAPSLLGRA